VRESLGHSHLSLQKEKQGKKAEKSHRSSEREGNLHSVAFIQNLPFSYFSQEE
jgi:hypothetical protein